MILKSIQIILDNNGDLVDRNYRPMRSHSDYKYVMQIVAPALATDAVDLTVSTYSNEKVSKTTRLRLAKDADNVYLKGSDVVSESEVYYTQVSDYNVWEVEMVGTILSVLQKINTTKIAIGVEFFTPTTDPNATNKLGTFGSASSTTGGDLPTVTTELVGDYYECDVLSFTSSKLGIQVGYKDIAYWNGLNWIKGSVFILRQSSPIIYFKVDPSLEALYSDLDISEVLGEVLIADVAALDGVQAAVNASIAGNTTAISALNTRTSTAEANIVLNDSDILALEGRATALETSVGSRDAEIAALDVRITSNDADILGNDTDIATNAAGIVTNANAIIANTALITSNDTDIATNAAGILANTALITSNDVDIAALVSGLALKANISDTDTSAEIDAKIAALVASSPAALDTLNELATALGNDPDFATTITNLIGVNTADIATNVIAIALNTAKVSFDTASSTKLDGIEAGAEVNDLNTTLQGNTFNGVSQLVQTTALGKLPALDGSLVSNVSVDKELGELTDVTLTNPTVTQVLKFDGVGWVNAADAAIELTNVTVSASKTFALTDNDTIQKCTNSAGILLTVPPQSEVAFDPFTEMVVLQYGTGSVEIQAGVGVTINSLNATILDEQYTSMVLRQLAPDEWIVFVPTVLGSNLNSSDDLIEGTTNLYYTEARVSANSDVVANTAKTGITAQQTSDIIANNAKISYTDSAAVALNTAKVGITTQQTNDIIANNAKISYTDASTVSTNTTSISNHITNLTNPHTVTKAQIGLSNVDNTSDLNKPVSTAQATINDLKADLVGGLIPANQLPSYVDDVIEVATHSALPVTGEDGKLYVVVADETDGGNTSTYRWATTVYVQVSDVLSASEAKTLYESNANTNAFTNAEQSKLSGIEDSATADQTPSEIKTAYESNADTNAFTDADHTKLNGIAEGAQVNDADTVLAPLGVLPVLDGSNLTGILVNNLLPTSGTWNLVAYTDAINPEGRIVTQNVGDNSVAFGKDVRATQSGSIAVGRNAQATGISSIAIGDTVGSTGTGSTVLGSTATSSSTFGVSIGYGATGSGDRMVKIGYGDSHYGTDTIQLGEATSNTLVDNSFYVWDHKLLDKTSGLIPAARIPDLSGTYLTDYTVTELDVTTHQAALSITESQISDLQAYLTSTSNLDASKITGTISSSNMPSLALTDVFTAIDETAHLALTAQEGDIVIRSDESKSYVHNGGIAGTMADYNELLTPTDTVTSVNSLIGAVVLDTGDISEGSNLYYTEARVSSNTNVAANTAKVGITAQQASDITANNAKVGITTEQSNAIVANTAKVSYNGEVATHESTYDHSNIGHAHPYLADSTTTISAQQVIDITANNAKISYTDGAIVSANQTAVANLDTNYLSRDLINGTFKESFDAIATVTATIDLTLEQSGGGDLTMQFSDGNTVLDCTPAQSIQLTPGTATVPQSNYIYIPQATKVLTKSTTGWPVGEHIKVSYLNVLDVSHTDGPLINQNWNDHTAGTDNMGHLPHITRWIREQGASYFSGINGIGSDGFIDIVGAAAYWKTSAGVVSQLHEHTFPAKDTSLTDIIHVVNHPTVPYTEISDISTLTTDATGASINNKYMNLVFWGVANKSGTNDPMMVNLPSGSYNSVVAAVADGDNFDNTDIPREFRLDSGTGFLIARITVRISGGTLTVEDTVDLRGKNTASLSSGGIGGVSFDNPDSLFSIYDTDDNTKEIVFNAGNITTGVTRTITMADTDINLADIALKANIADVDTSLEVDAKLAALIDTAPGTLDTLNELAAALGDDPNFATTVTNSIATKETITNVDTLKGVGWTTETVKGNADNIATNVTAIALNTAKVSADANATNQGNIFNGANQLVQLNGTGQLPALDGSNLTNVSTVSGIDDLSDVVVTAPVTDQVLAYNGTSWVNETIQTTFNLDGGSASTVFSVGDIIITGGAA